MRREYFLTNLHVTSGERSNKSFSSILEIALKMIMGIAEYRYRSASGHKIGKEIRYTVQMLNVLKERIISM